MKKFLPLVVLILLCVPGFGATNPDLLSKQWSARWIAVPNAPAFDYGIYHFRRAFDVKDKPASFVVHVSGDNRYQLYVNGERVVWGPARGDLFNWRYETVDIAPYLRPGRNLLAAVVWNYARLAPESQITNQTGFLLQGDTDTERIVDTNSEWKGTRNEAYAPLPVTRDQIPEYFAAGPGEQVQASAYPWGWEQISFDDSGWQRAREMAPGTPRSVPFNPSRWMLVPRSVPLMEERPERLQRVRQARGIPSSVPQAFPRQPAPFQIPARTKARLLLDQNHLTTAYPELLVSGGKDARISLRYAEALFVSGTRDKGNRDEVEGKELKGYQDIFVADGGARRLFRPLWWRTYRYIELNIETADEPLTLEDMRGTYTGYPFERKARFDAGSDELKKILDVGWRTARLCAHETYMDTPYYEQLQYVGDTRIQALISLYETGDARLMRNAIQQIDDSRTPEGLTMSRAPTRLQQYIPPFSLWWIGMTRDYWMYTDDPALVREMLPGVRAVLAFFAARQKANGSLSRLPWWRYVDWVKSWDRGEPPMAADGSSAPLDLQLILAYDWAAEMEAALGSKALATEYGRAAAQLRATTQNLYWDEARRLYADTPQRDVFSQHTNALAILAGVIEGAAARDLIERVATDASLVQCSIYFRHYLHSAMHAAGAGDRYLDMLGEWRAQLARGLTTWAEKPEPSRSDCHAWGSSPNYELFRTVLGIDSAAPEFARVRVQPFLGKLTKVSGAIPHPKGEIAVSLERRADGKLQVEVSLPKEVPGEFIWRSVRHSLAPGKTSKLIL